MEKLAFVVEKTTTGFSAYNCDNQEVIGTTGQDIAELKENIVEATNLYYEYKGRELITIDQIELIQERQQ